MPFPLHLVQPLNKAAPKAIGKENGRAAIRAGGKELEFTMIVNAVVDGHDGGEYTLDGVAPEESIPSEHPFGIADSPRQEMRRPRAYLS